jgi:hypothetical protein
MTRLHIVPPADYDTRPREPTVFERIGAFIRFNAPALVLGFTAGLLAVLVPALVIGMVQ